MAVLVCFLIGFFVPSHTHTRVPANESSMIGDIRTMISAQASYQSASGAYGLPRCLMKPKDCLPDYPRDGPWFLDASFAQDTRQGYSRTFHAGPSAEPPARGVRSFAYVGVPTTPGRTGVRAFCGDETGRICYVRDGRMPPISEGRCPQACETLQ
jgi:hypothetical protein